jgi:AmmeMemoRadiSam system protein A
VLAGALADPRKLHWTLARPWHGRSVCTSSREATTKQLEPADKKLLLDVARHAIESAVCHDKHLGRPLDSPSAAVAEPAAAFVTLHERGELRGCIGLMRYDVPLWLNVRDAAVAAALDDPRFLPVGESEVPALELEVSVLEPPVELPDPAGFEAGRHGIVVERGMRRALLLPQVASEQGWDAEQMLDAVCRKAGLPGTSWREKETRLFVFESACFSEKELAGLANPSRLT